MVYPIPALKESKDAELVAVAEVDDEKLKEFLKENKNVVGYNNANDLIKNQKLDFVIIAVPHCKHYEITKNALNNKIHVLKEKPFAVSLKEAVDLKNLAEKNDVQVSITLQRRFNPIYSTFFQLVDKIGKIFYIDAVYTFHTDFPDEGWRGKKELAGGGCLIDMGYHLIDLLMWYFGLPDKVFADMSSTAKEGASYDAEDTARVIFRYEDRDAWGSLLVSRFIFPKQEFLNVYGTRGTIHLERGIIERYSIDGKLQESLKRENSWPSAAQDQIDYFIKVIKGEKENINGPESHLNHMAFVEAAYKSKKDGCYVNPKKLKS
ncbi:Gfo/Idh/MocA family oxidoreductase [Patescibacteria group bacterium]|nr:Gfo/Idh/MocA family oxidoreductase [Patescibacteria group bacterium]